MKLGRRLSDWTHRLHKKYLEMKNVKGEDFARRNPPDDCSLDQWTRLINNKWNDPKFLVTSTSICLVLSLNVLSTNIQFFFIIY